MKFRIGIDVGGTAIKAGVVDENLRLVSKCVRATDADRPFETVVRDMAGAANEAAAAVGLRLADFDRIGVGTPSFINPDTGLLVLFANNNWKNVDLAKELKDHLPMSVRIENDANCAIWGETLAGAAKGRRDVLMLTLGTGLGGGLVLGGRLYTGTRGMGVELGHVPFVAGGEPCTCGISGCFEAYASVTALIRQTRDAMRLHPDSALHAYTARSGGRVNGRTAFDCAKAGDEAALAVVNAYIEYLANGIGGFVNVFRPEVVLIGGGLSNEGDYLIAPLNARVGKYVYARAYIGAPPILRATLGNDAGIIGAACLV